MKIQFQISPEEYINAGLLNGEIRGITKKVHLLIEAFLLAAGLLFVFLENYIVAAGMVGAVIGANLLPYLLRRFYLPWYLRRHYWKYPIMQKSQSLSVLENGVEFESESGRGVIGWAEIHHWREGKELLLIYPAPRIYYLVPQGVSQSINLRQVLSERVGDEC